MQIVQPVGPQLIFAAKSVATAILNNSSEVVGFSGGIVFDPLGAYNSSNKRYKVADGRYLVKGIITFSTGSVGTIRNISFVYRVPSLSAELFPYYGISTNAPNHAHATSIKDLLSGNTIEFQAYHEGGSGMTYLACVEIWKL